MWSLRRLTRCPMGLLALLVAVLVLARPAQAADPAPLIAAAANLQVALGEIQQQFKADTGQDVRLSFGSTGNIVRQIRAGAPYEMFLSAEEALVIGLARDGLVRDEGHVYAVGRLALFVPTGSPLQPDGRLDDLATALKAGKVRRFAIANPELAPYGKAAVQALRRKGLWDALSPSVVMGESIAQAAQFASTGAAEGGIIALSLAQAPELARLGRFAPIPGDWHEPLRQRMVLTRKAGAAAERFLGYVQGAKARAILGRHGYEVPEAAR